MRSPFRRRFRLIIALAIATLLLIPAMSIAGNDDGPMTVSDIEFIGEVVVPTGTMFEGTEIGGLSSISFDKGRQVYHTISDDQGTLGSVRYYTVAIDISDGSFDPGDLTFTAVTTIFEEKKSEFAPGGLDPEGLVLARGGQLYVSSEGKTSPLLDPFIYRYNLNGRRTAELPIPGKYLPNGIDWGVRSNLGFESLNITPNGRQLVTAGEAALFQDGPAPTYTNGSLARVLTYDIHKRVPVSEYVYEVDPWAEPTAIFGVNGIVEVLPIDDYGTTLVMERSFSVGGTLGHGTGNYVVIYEASSVGATDVLDTDALYEGGSPIALTQMSKDLIFAFDDIGVAIDNIEGMTFGPVLPDGRQSLVIVSDNNFNAGQFTQFIVLALDIEPAS